MHIYDNILQIARSKKMTIKDIAKQTGLSRDSIGKWNEHSPSVSNLKSVADALGVEIAVLIS